MKIHISDTPQEAARVVTHQLLKQLDTIRKDSFSLAISGGYSAELLFRLWAEMYYKSLPWYRIHLYWVDERCVSPTDGDSNYGLAKKLFLDKVKIPHMQIHRIMGEANPQHEAQRYSELVKKNLPDNDGYPQFDMLILGMGTDGHTSSVFPGQNDLLTSPQPYAASINPYNGQRRPGRFDFVLCHRKRKGRNTCASTKSEYGSRKVPSRIYRPACRSHRIFHR